jgi:hypothetical protein
LQAPHRRRCRRRVMVVRGGNLRRDGAAGSTPWRCTAKKTKLSSCHPLQCGWLRQLCHPSCVQLNSSLLVTRRGSLKQCFYLFSAPMNQDTPCSDSEVITSPCNILHLREPYLLRSRTGLTYLEAFDSDFGVFEGNADLKQKRGKRKPRSKRKPQRNHWLNADDTLATPGPNGCR